MKKIVPDFIWVLLCIAFPFLYASLVYNQLPSTIPMHFNIKGEADGWGPKENIFMLPVIMGVVSVIVYSLLSNLKKIDPKRYEKSNTGYFRRFGIFAVLFLTIISVTIIYATVHPGEISVNRLIFPVLGLGMAALGLYMPNIPQNYFVGLRLPWTLENIDNWKATHAFGGKVWLAGGLCIMAASFILKPEIFGIVFLIIIGMMIIIPVIYSYKIFRESKKNDM